MKPIIAITAVTLLGISFVYSRPNERREVYYEEEIYYEDDSEDEDEDDYHDHHRHHRDERPDKRPEKNRSITETIESEDLYTVRGGKYKGGKSCTVTANYTQGRLDASKCHVAITEIRFYDIDDELLGTWKSGNKPWKGGEAYEKAGKPLAPRSEPEEMKITTVPVFPEGSLQEKNISCKDATDIPVILLVSGGEKPVCQKRYERESEHIEFAMKDQTAGIGKSRILPIPSRGENAIVGICEFGFHWGKKPGSGQDVCLPDGK